MAQQESQVWWSWSGGIGAPTTIPLKGGAKKSKTRKSRKSKKSRKAKATRRR